LLLGGGALAAGAAGAGAGAAAAGAGAGAAGLADAAAGLAPDPDAVAAPASGLPPPVSFCQNDGVGAGSGAGFLNQPKTVFLKVEDRMMASAKKTPGGR
jgi:hypothetical protein